MMYTDTRAALAKLVAYCRTKDWAGYDPYDALNSRLFDAVPLLNSRLPRIALTQVLKRSPFNIRGLAMIPTTQNPKGLALFLAGFLHLERMEPCGHEDLIEFMIERLVALRSPGVP